MGLRKAVLSTPRTLDTQYHTVRGREAWFVSDVSSVSVTHLRISNNSGKGRYAEAAQVVPTLEMLLPQAAALPTGPRPRVI